jgi:RNA recognition motif-containing protein
MSLKVSVLKELGELDQLRVAREDFAAKYPLTSELWLAWLRDEQGIASTDEEKATVHKLFEKAVKDYVTVPLYLEFCQFACGSVGTAEGNAAARDVFERALTVVGLNVAEGGLVWDAYREFELALVACAPADQAQRDRVKKVFQRQLSIPLLDMDTTLEEYLEFSGQGKPDKAVEMAYNQAKKMLDERMPFEEKLLKSAKDAKKNSEAFAEYIELELKAGLPARIQSLYERRATEHCLVPHVWAEYVRYLDTQLKHGDVSLAVHERACRNCTWSGELWTGYVRSMEKYGKEDAELTKVFERAMAAGGLSYPADYLKVWLAYLDYRRRKTFSEDEEDPDTSKDERDKRKSALRLLFPRAKDSLAAIEGADPEFRVARYWAAVEGDRFRAMDNARTIWAEVVSAAGDKAHICLDYIQLEKIYGDTKHLRKLFPRLLERCQDMPEVISEAWLQFEREEGSLDQFEEAEAKIGKRMGRTVEKRKKEEDATEQEQARRAEKVEKKKEKDKDYRRDKRHQAADDKKQNNFKRRADDSGASRDQPPAKKAMDSDGFKVPSVPAMGGVAPPPGFKGTVAPPPGFKGKVAPPPGFKGGDDASDQKQAETETSSKDACTVFLSNLDYNETEEQVKEAMEKSGTVNEVRLIKTPAGRSKGFAYIEFSTAEEAKKALLRDHEKLSGRPMYVSECDASKRGHNFKYGQGMEKNKLFVKNLPTTLTKNDVANLFAVHGAIKAVRLVEYRTGQSKGIAFVEFENESDAAKAIMVTDNMLVQNQTIEVAISNPPEKRGGGFVPQQEERRSLGSGTREAAGAAAAGTRGRGGPTPRGGRVQLTSFIPRALMAKSKDAGGAAGGAEAKNGATEKPKSNDQFRNMLLNEKK